MTISTTTATAWDLLPLDTRVMFYDIASKETSNMTAAEWFDHLVPAPLQDNPQEVEVFMNGGTVTQEVWVHDQGVANGHYEQVTYEIPDKDVSRITSGANGGEYTADNTVMEDMSINRSRGPEDMTDSELASAQEMNALETEFIDGGSFTEVANTSSAASESAPDLGEVVLDTFPTWTEVPVGTLPAAGEVITSSSGPFIAPVEAGGAAIELSEIAEGVLDGILPVTYGAKAANHVWQSTNDMEDHERVAVTALAGGATVGATYTALAVVPGLNLVLGGIALWKLGQVAYKAADKWYTA